MAYYDPMDDGPTALDLVDDDELETCEDCGERWNPGVHPATRVDPAYADHPECPACGGEPVRD